MHQPGEPSVEEILDSIKKVIARDNREGAIAERRRRTMNGEQNDPVEPVAQDEAEEVLELDEGAMVSLENEELPQMGDTDAPLTREEKLSSIRDNFAALAMISQPGKQPQIVRTGETSLEGLVGDLLRPMLAEWIDANLPSMVEDLVKAEISRIAGKRS